MCKVPVRTQLRLNLRNSRWKGKGCATWQGSWHYFSGCTVLFFFLSFFNSWPITQWFKRQTMVACMAPQIGAMTSWLAVPILRQHTEQLVQCATVKAKVDVLVINVLHNCHSRLAQSDTCVHLNKQHLKHHLWKHQNTRQHRSCKAKTQPTQTLVITPYAWYSYHNTVEYTT